MQVSLISFWLLLFSWQHMLLHVTGNQKSSKKDPPQVTLSHGGIISGQVEVSRGKLQYNSFMGIPYAKIPGRFQESQPITKPPWQGVFAATAAGPKCVQLSMLNVVGAEDCLSLNVYVPTHRTERVSTGYPVMVWIHGGGFLFGCGSDNGPQYFMDEEIVVVTINYRLNIFGFLSTGDGVIPGNNGLKDMVLALKWVRDNIERFSGNSAQVTISGESAGSAAVMYLLSSPTAKGLYHRAIAQSGSSINPWAYQPNPRETATALATFLKCPTTSPTSAGISSEEILTCFTNMSLQNLTKAQFYFEKNWPGNLKSLAFVPTIEHHAAGSTLTPFLTEPPISLLTRKVSPPMSSVNMLIGATEDEGAAMYAGVVMSNSAKLNEINTDWDNVAPTAFDFGKYLPIKDHLTVSRKLKQFYFGTKNISTETRASLVDLYSDEMILHGVYRSAMELASRGNSNPVYFYQYAYKGPPSVVALSLQVTGEEAKLVGHAEELQVQFDFGPAMFLAKPTPGSKDEEFSRNFVRLWASFVIHGDALIIKSFTSDMSNILFDREPRYTWGNATSKTWMPISKEELAGSSPMKWYRLQANPAMVDVNQRVKDRMQFWNGMWSDHLTPAIMSKYKQGKVK